MGEPANRWVHDSRVGSGSITLRSGPGRAKGVNQARVKGANRRGEENTGVGFPSIDCRNSVNRSPDASCATGSDGNK